MSGRQIIGGLVLLALIFMCSSFITELVGTGYK